MMKRAVQVLDRCPPFRGWNPEVDGPPSSFSYTEFSSAFVRYLEISYPSLRLRFGKKNNNFCPGLLPLEQSCPANRGVGKEKSDKEPTDSTLSVAFLSEI